MYCNPVKGRGTRPSFSDQYILQSKNRVLGKILIICSPNLLLGHGWLGRIRKSNSTMDREGRRVVDKDARVSTYDKGHSTMMEETKSPKQLYGSQNRQP